MVLVGECCALMGGGWSAYYIILVARIWYDGHAFGLVGQHSLQYLLASLALVCAGGTVSSCLTESRASNTVACNPLHAFFGQLLTWQVAGTATY